MEYIGFLDESIRHGVDESYGLVVIPSDSVDIAYNVLMESYRRILRRMGKDYLLNEAKFSEFLAAIHKKLGFLSPKEIYQFVLPIMRSLRRYVFFRGILLRPKTQPPSFFLNIEQVVNEK